MRKKYLKRYQTFHIYIKNLIFFGSGSSVKIEKIGFGSGAAVLILWLLIYLRNKSVETSDTGFSGTGKNYSEIRGSKILAKRTEIIK